VYYSGGSIDFYDPGDEGEESMRGVEGSIEEPNYCSEPSILVVVVCSNPWIGVVHPGEPVGCSVVLHF
jgi:hypothetical protein